MVDFQNFRIEIIRLCTAKVTAISSPSSLRGALCLASSFVPHPYLRHLWLRDTEQIGNMSGFKSFVTNLVSHLQKFLAFFQPILHGWAGAPVMDSVQWPAIVLPLDTGGYHDDACHTL